MVTGREWVGKGMETGREGCENREGAGNRERRRWELN